MGCSRVELVQIPTPNEANDTIAPIGARHAAAPGTPFDISYRMFCLKNTDRNRDRMGGADTARAGIPAYAGQRHGEHQATVILTARRCAVAGQRATAGGRCDRQRPSTDLVVHRNDATGAWRMVVQMRTQDKEKPIEVRALLRNGKEVLGETWNYVIPLMQ